MFIVLMIILGIGVAVTVAMFMVSASHTQSNQTLSDNDDNQFDALLDDFLENIYRYNVDDLKELKSNLQEYLDNRSQSVILSQLHSSKQSAFHDLLLNVFSHQYKSYQIHMMLDSIDSYLIEHFSSSIKSSIINKIEQYLEDNYGTDDDILFNYNKIDIYHHIEKHPLFQENQELMEECKDELEYKIYSIVKKIKQDIVQRQYLEEKLKEKKSMQRQWQSYPNNNSVAVAPKKSNIAHSTQFNNSSFDMADIIVATTLLTDDDVQDEDDVSLASSSLCSFSASYASSDSYSSASDSDSYSSSYSDSYSSYS